MKLISVITFEYNQDFLAWQRVKGEGLEITKIESIPVVSMIDGIANVKWYIACQYVVAE